MIFFNKKALPKVNFYIIKKSGLVQRKERVETPEAEKQSNQSGFVENR